MLHKILDNWLWWLLCIVALRLVSFLFVPPVISPQETSINSLLTTATRHSDEEIRTLAWQALTKSARMSTENSQKILASLEKDIQDPSLNHRKTEISHFVEDLHKDPLFVLMRAGENIQSPILVYLQPVCFFLCFFSALIFLVLIPWFLEFFVSQRALPKMLGNKGKYFLVAGNIIVWGLTAYMFYRQNEHLNLIMHGLFIVSSLAILVCMIRTGLLTILLEIPRQKAPLVLAVTALFLFSTLIPYGINRSRSTVIKVSDQEILQALQSVRHQNIIQAQSFLFQILNYHEYYSLPVLRATIETLGAIGNESVLPLLNPFLQYPHKSIQAASLNAVGEILTRKYSSQSK